MDTLILSRLQFAITTIYHFFLVPLTLGLTIMIAIFESRYVATGNEMYKSLAKFWGKLFLINFGAGVVTGILQEFHFGMNWSGYSRFVGDIFGVPLAIESLTSFFMESTFIGLWVFGWDKLPKKIHLACAWLVAFSSNLSAFWILIANSFMQNPVGYAIENGRAVMTSFWALVANPNLPYQFFHIFFAGFVTAGFVVLGFSAWHLLRKKENVIFFQTSFKLAALFALVGILLVGVMGDAHGKYLFRAQPMKISAAEAIWEDEEPADFILIANLNEQNETNEFEIRIPKALSFLLYTNFTGGVKGLKTLQAEAVSQYGPGDYIPPVTLTFWSFRVMVGVGLLMALLALLAVLKPRLKFLDKSRVFLKILPFAMALPYIGTTSGWILTEEARQPWIVYGLQKVSQGVSPNLTVGGVLFSLILFFVLLGALVGVTGWLIIKSGLAEPQVEKSPR